MDEPLDDWFAREILSHEAALVRYLKRSWQNYDEIDDLRQETYVRVYEASTHRRPTEPKSFLFTTARHLMTDRLRRKRIVSIEATGDIEALNVSVDELSPEQVAGGHQELRHLAAAFDLLPPRCREVVWLRKVEGLSQKEVAARMGITEGVIEKHITKGVRLLARLLLSGERVSGAPDASGSPDMAEARHGKQHRD
jgi:RNA polymerase sigma-70 factor (ECF subfamily)